MTEVAEVRARPAAAAPRGRGRGRSLAWFGLVPFFAFVGLFLLWPALSVFRNALTTEEGGFTLATLGRGMTDYRSSFISSIRLSVVTALLGGILGWMLAQCVVTLQRPRWLRSVVTAWSGVAANLGGIPLAFAFVAALGAQGLLTKWLRVGGIDLRLHGFDISSFWGLVVVYLYFQIPLMLLVMTPAIDGLRATWQEAAANLGASRVAYWRHVGLPILMPSALGGFLLLFANAFAAYATAFALSGGSANLVPLQIRFLLQGNVAVAQEGLGGALAAWMILIMAVAVVLNLLLQRRTSRWLR